MNRYDIEITGRDLKRFLKNLYNMKIQFYKISQTDKSLVICVDESDYQKIINIKTIYEIQVIKLYGPIKIKTFIKKYRLFFLFLIINFLFIMFLTHVIFDVQVVHTKKEIRDLIYEELETRGIKKYRLVSSFQKQEKVVEEVIKKNRDIIEWMEIERIGVKYIVKVEERKEKELDNNDEPRDLVAKKDGYVTNIEASQGYVLITPGTYVKKGDILVTGSIKNKDTLMAKVRATGKVYAETWYDVRVELPYHYSEKKRTGKKRKVFTYKFFNSYHDLFTFSNYKNKEIENIFELKNNLLPISFSLNTEYELDITDNVYTKDNAVIEASRIARDKLKKKLDKDDKILYEKSLKITEEDSKIVVVIFFKVKENITEYKEIALEELEKDKEEVR